MTRDVKRLYQFGEFRVDTAERVLFRENEPIFLPPKVYDTLLILISNAGHTLEKEYLLRELWPDTFVVEGNLAENNSLFSKTKSFLPGCPPSQKCQATTHGGDIPFQECVRHCLRGSAACRKPWAVKISVRHLGTI